MREVLLRTDLWSDQILVLRSVQTLTMLDVQHGNTSTRRIPLLWAGAVNGVLAVGSLEDALAGIDQANSTIGQAEAALHQGQTNANLARVTAERWANLFRQGIVSL